MNNLLLASTSPTRRKILKEINFKFIYKKPLINEELEKKKIKNKKPETICQLLAKKKSLYTSLKYKSYYVLGVDTCLIFKDKFLSKPKTKLEAKKMLNLLNGKEHKIYSSIYISKNNRKLWSYNDEAILKLKKLTTKEINIYIKKLKIKNMKSSGLYQIEDIGITLFEKIKGSYFTILGLPLIPLLNFLKKRGIKF